MFALAESYFKSRITNTWARAWIRTSLRYKSGLRLRDCVAGNALQL